MKEMLEFFVKKSPRYINYLTKLNSKLSDGLKQTSPLLLTITCGVLILFIVW